MQVEIIAKKSGGARPRGSNKTLTLTRIREIDMWHSQRSAEPILLSTATTTEHGRNCTRCAEAEACAIRAALMLITRMRKKR